VQTLVSAEVASLERELTKLHAQLAQAKEEAHGTSCSARRGLPTLRIPRAEAERWSVQQHAMVDEQAAPELRRLIQCMCEEDEARSACVLAVACKGRCRRDAAGGGGGAAAAAAAARDGRGAQEEVVEVALIAAMIASDCL
jgi:hypothetical protein